MWVLLATLKTRCFHDAVATVIGLARLHGFVAGNGAMAKAYTVNGFKWEERVLRQVDNRARAATRN